MTHFSKILKVNLFLVILLCAGSVFSQISLVLNQPNPYFFTAKDVWNATLINTTNVAVDSRLTVIIFTSDKVKIVELKSDVIKIKTGVMQLSPFIVTTENISYYDPELMQRENQGLGLMPGKYIVCFYANCATPDCNGANKSIFFDGPICETIILENPTPLLLVNPEHKSEIEETRPALIWQPPSPILPGTRMVYWVTLSPKLKNQNAIEAMQLNRPLFNIPIEMNNILPFPQDIPALEPDHEYTWKVEAKTNERTFATSEVWQFKVIKPIKKRKIPKIFVKVNDVRKDKHAVEDSLRFIYIEDRFAQTNIQYKIISSDGTDLQPLKVLNCSMGENRYILDLRPLGLNDGEDYSLIVVTPTNTLLPLKFTFYSSGN